MKEYEVVFNVYGHTQLWYHSAGSVSYSKKIECEDGDGNITYMLKDGHISFIVEADSPEAAYKKAIILWMKTDTGLLTIDDWNLRCVCDDENRWTKNDLDENGNVVLGDEMLTPDSSRFWPLEGYEAGKGQPSFDKQFARDWLKANDGNHDWTLPQEIVDKTIEKYLQAYEMLTGKPLA